MREPVERRGTIVFDARPPGASASMAGIAAAFQPRDLDEPPPPPAEQPRHHVRDLANIAVYGLTWGEMMAMARGQTGEPEDNCPLANSWAAAFHKWAAKHLGEAT
jgi:hypothetical protein